MTVPMHVLLVEDSPTDVLMTREAMAGCGLPVQLHTVEDGVEAMQFLRQEGPYAGAPRPCLVLLDLNLPRKNGKEVLAEVRADPKLGCLPVVVLTTSQSDQDVAQVYRLRANCYVTKPVSFAGFEEVVKKIETFWLTVAKLPPAET
jgi:CheY-like chemotaxis protein